MMIPEINKTYNYFDNGVISKSRQLTVKITEIVPFDEISEDIMELWKDDLKYSSQLYAQTTDFFIKGMLNIGDEDIETIFVRTIDNRWFSLGYWGGVLDINGSLLKSYEKS